MAGRGYQKIDASRWDVVLTVQLSTHATVSIKPVRFCFQSRSLGRVYCRNSPQRPTCGQRKLAAVAASERQRCNTTPVLFNFE